MTLAFHIPPLDIVAVTTLNVLYAIIAVVLMWYGAYMLRNEKTSLGKWVGVLVFLAGVAILYVVVLLQTSGGR